jgi:protein-disulfide isomerase
MNMRPALRLLLASLATLPISAAHAQLRRGAERPTAITGVDSAARARLSRADLARIRGRDSAPVWIVVITDFQCPFCKRWHEETLPLLERNYVRTGKARIAYLNFPVNTHRNAPPAHEFAMCAAEQERFWPVADALFDTQSGWKSLVNPAAFFDSVATRLRLDRTRLRACIDGGEQRALIRADYERSLGIGVGSTPSFIIGGTPLVGAQPYEVFARAVDDALARHAASQRPAAAVAPRTTPPAATRP